MSTSIKLLKQTLSSFNRFVDLKHYCDQHLEKVGAGTSRLVYLLDDDAIIKVAKNRKGLLQNEAECDYGRNHWDLSFRLIDNDKFYRWLVCERLQKCKKSDFKRLLGISFEQAELVIRHFASMYDRKMPKYHSISAFKKTFEQIEQMLNQTPAGRVWLESVEYYLSDFQPKNIGDFLRVANWGLAKRQGYLIPVIADFGFTEILY